MTEKIKGKAGRPKELKEKWVKATITLYNDQVVWLDRLTTEIRLNTMAVVDRGMIIRAIVDAIRESKIDLTQLTTEQEFKEIFLKTFKKP